MVGSGGAERRITGGPSWGRRRNVRFIVGNLYRGPPRATEDIYKQRLKRYMRTFFAEVHEFIRLMY